MDDEERLNQIKTRWADGYAELGQNARVDFDWLLERVEQLQKVMERWSEASRSERDQAALEGLMVELKHAEVRVKDFSHMLDKAQNRIKELETDVKYWESQTEFWENHAHEDNQRLSEIKAVARELVKELQHAVNVGLEIRSKDPHPDDLADTKALLERARALGLDDDVLLVFDAKKAREKMDEEAALVHPHEEDQDGMLAEIAERNLRNAYKEGFLKGWNAGIDVVSERFQGEDKQVGSSMRTILERLNNNEISTRKAMDLMAEVILKFKEET